MTIKASGRLALMIATGLFVCLAGPLPASAAGSDTAASKSDSAAAGKAARQSTRHGRRDAQREPSRTADKSPEASKAGAETGKVTSAGMPASVANANAELTAGDGSANTKTTLAAADKPAGDSNVVAEDQLNDLDRALQQTQSDNQQQAPAAQQQAPAPQQQTVAMAPAKPAPVLASGESTSLDQTSLIGKIFIGFGALLTMASAARMFMA